jgi:putative transposase
MPRQPRSNLADGTYHVTGRATGGADLFVVELDRVEFLELLRASARRFGWACHAYCLMGTHYHLILETPREGLSSGMQRLNGIYAQRFNYRHRRRGRLFEGRFAAYVLRDERHFGAALQYLLDNPVRAGLCTEPAEWRWSGLGAPR